MLYIVGTPIGNLEDITLRALRILKEVDVIVCEDTRQTLKLLKHYSIPKKPLVSYNEFSEKRKTPEDGWQRSRCPVAARASAFTELIESPDFLSVR